MKKDKKTNKKKQKKWILRRHKIVRDIVGIFFGPIVRRKYGVKVQPFTEGAGKQYLVLYNHQTAYDQFFVGLAFPGAVYYVASEDIFSMGWVSKLIRFLVNPIPIKKQTTDPRAVINCIKVAREGGTIAIAPEGNRTYSGAPAYIKPAIASLARHLGLPIAIFRIEGGFGVHPRWSDVVRDGAMTAGVSRVIEPEEYKELDDGALAQLIERELNVNEARSDRTYESEHLAEYIERAMYVCPECGLSEFESHGDVVKCKKCGLAVRYMPNTELCGVDSPFPYKYLSEWYDYQCDYVNSLNTLDLTSDPVYEDDVQMSEVILYKKKTIVCKSAKISLYGDRVVLKNGDQEYTVFFDDISAMSVLGKNKLNLYTGSNVYQFKGNERFCALKYVNLYYRYKNIRKGDENVKFLGL